MKKAIFIIITTLLVIGFSKSNSQAINISDEAIRLRIVANSDSQYDQDIKLKVKSLVEQELVSSINSDDSITDVRQKIKDSIPIFDKKINKLFKDFKYNQTYTINYGMNYFPTKEYNGVTYNAGNYESLLINIGNAEGHNWWCILFPPLCLLEAEESDQVEYKFFVTELLDKFLNH